ncbi:MAG: hypothetical protein WC028_00290 [Candidatus Obscuribacterales bacterium]
MIEAKAIKPRAINPPVWLVSLIGIAIACTYSTLNRPTDKPEALAIQSIEETVSTAPNKQPKEQPTEERNLGQYTYQYFTGTDSHQPYFRLLDGELEVFKQSAANASYNLQPIESIDLLRYGYQPNADNFVVPLSSEQSVIVIEQVDKVEQVEEAEEASEQRHYLVLKLSPVKLLTTLHSGSNQFVIRKITESNNNSNNISSNNGHYQLVGSDQLEAWGQQPVSPKVVFDLVRMATSLGLHHSAPRKKEQLVKQSKEIQAQFADLNSVEEAPITFAPAQLAAEMADLIYEGNSKQAKFLLDRSWPRNTRGKAQFQKAFDAELAKGQFSGQVAALNHP